MLHSPRQCEHSIITKNLDFEKGWKTRMRGTTVAVKLIRLQSSLKELAKRYNRNIYHARFHKTRRKFFQSDVTLKTKRQGCHTQATRILPSFILIETTKSPKRPSICNDFFQICARRMNWSLSNAQSWIYIHFHWGSHFVDRRNAYWTDELRCASKYKRCYSVKSTPSKTKYIKFRVCATAWLLFAS